MCANIS